MLTDPGFLAAAAFAVVLTGISKSGFVGGGAMMAVPIMSLFVAPQVAAGIMLPILVAIDTMNVWRYRKDWSSDWYRAVIPGAIAGIVIGTLLFRYISPSGLRIGIGALALFFAVRHFLRIARRAAPQPIAKPGGSLLSMLGGLGSFVAHAGGPPIDAYLLSQRLGKTVLMATNVYLFATINAIKLVPYFFLGLLSFSNLSTSLLLLPLVPAGVLLGQFLHHRVPQALFERIAYTLLTLTGIKLLWDGLSALV